MTGGTMTVTREQYLDYMTFGNVERLLFVELFGPLVGLEDEWRAQGAREDEIDLTAFGFDHIYHHHVQVNVGLMGGGDEVLLCETPEYAIRRDAYGRTVKLFKSSATIALPLDH